MTKRIESLLFEAYRRNRMADACERLKPLTARWLGLGTEAAYRPALKAGLMVFHDGQTPPPRCMGWLCLTPAGVNAMQHKEKKFSFYLRRMRKAGYDSTILANFMLSGGIVS